MISPEKMPLIIFHVLNILYFECLCIHVYIYAFNDNCGKKEIMNLKVSEEGFWKASEWGNAGKIWSQFYFPFTVRFVCPVEPVLFLSSKNKTR